MLLLSGDVPLLTAASVARVLDVQRARQAAVVVATAEVPDPTGYGRMIREGGALVRIVEHRDATAAEREVREINSGVYVFELAPLFAALARLGSSNAQGEYYLPDLVDINRRDGRVVEAVKLDDADEIRGINTRAELAEVGRVLQAPDQRRAHGRRRHAGRSGHRLHRARRADRPGHDPSPVRHPRRRDSSIGAGCELHAGTRISDSTLGDGVTVLEPFGGGGLDRRRRRQTWAICQNSSRIGDWRDVHVGNFVEIKKSQLGKGTKVGHLTYLGDATVGAGVNVGAGTITCNYDGRKKHRTVIGDGAFVGSDSTLVAPVRVGEGAYVAAGSAITDDVPDGALGIARGRQTNKTGWVAARASKDDPTGR